MIIFLPAYIFDFKKLGLKWKDTKFFSHSTKKNPRFFQINLLKKLEKNALG